MILHKTMNQILKETLDSDFGLWAIIICIHVVKVCGIHYSIKYETKYLTQTNYSSKSISLLYTLRMHKINNKPMIIKLQYQLYSL